MNLLIYNTHYIKSEKLITICPNAYVYNLCEYGYLSSLKAKTAPFSGFRIAIMRKEYKRDVQNDFL